MITREMLRVVAEQARSLRYDVTSVMPSGTDIDALVAAAMPAIITLATEPPRANLADATHNPFH